MYVTAPELLVISKEQPCWACGAVTPVFSLLVNPEFQLENDDSRDPLTAQQKLARENICLLAYVKWILGAQAVSRLSEFAPSYFEDFSKAADDSYYMNHCAHCAAKIGDKRLYAPGGLFDVDNLARRREGLPSVGRISSPAEIHCVGLSPIFSHPSRKETVYHQQGVEVLRDRVTGEVDIFIHDAAEKIRLEAMARARGQSLEQFLQAIVTKVFKT